jgi:hypothetical protein
MSYNVPAVYDVLPARIRACVARPGLAKMWVECGVGMSVANDLATRNPEGATAPEAYTDLLCAVGPYTIFILFILIIILYSLV